MELPRQALGHSPAPSASASTNVDQLPLPPARSSGADHNFERLAAKYRAVEENEARWEEADMTDDCEILFVVAYRHSPPAMARAAVVAARSQRASRPASSGPSPCGPSPSKALQNIAMQDQREGFVSTWNSAWAR